MARIRSIKPEFFKHGDLQDLEIANPGQYVMLVYAGLWTQCDKNGVFFCKARELKNEILPYIPFNMQKTLDVLEKERYFVRYKVDNREYGYIPNFNKYQFPVKNEKDAPAKYPDCSLALTPRQAFMWLWDQINDKRGYSWLSNPWVWVIEFMRLPDGGEK